MSNQQQSFPESIDDVLSAVQETARGRWFLEAYAERLKKSETSSILASIAKLEDSLKSMTLGGAEVKLVETARAAIAAARKEIQQLNPEIVPQSREGQLFAKLAEQSRQAFGSGSASPATSKSVERALRLVADLEQDFAVGQPVEPVALASANPSHYFKQDEAIFEPAPLKPVLIVAEQKPASETPRGARLVIERVGGEAPLHSQEPKFDEHKADVMAPSPEIEERPRITIIRRNIEDLQEVPLPEARAPQEAGTAA